MLTFESPVRTLISRHRMHTTPPTLLQRLRLPNDSDAWKRFVDLYVPMLYHWSKRVGLRSADAADLVQEVLIHLIRIMPEFVYEPGRRFRGWLWTVFLNKFREVTRRKGPNPQTVEFDRLDEISVGDGVAEITEAEYRRYLMERALHVMRSEFQPSTWKACWETLIGGKRAEIVAGELGISPGAVRAAKFRVLSRLRLELRDLLED